MHTFSHLPPIGTDRHGPSIMIAVPPCLPFNCCGSHAGPTATPIMLLHGFGRPCNVHLNVRSRNSNTCILSLPPCLVNPPLHFGPRLCPSSVVISIPPCLPNPLLFHTGQRVPVNFLLPFFHGLIQLSTLIPFFLPDILTCLMSQHVLSWVLPESVDHPKGTLMRSRPGSTKQRRSSAFS